MGQALKITYFKYYSYMVFPIPRTARRQRAQKTLPTGPSANPAGYAGCPGPPSPAAAHGQPAHGRTQPVVGRLEASGPSCPATKHQSVQQRKTIQSTCCPGWLSPVPSRQWLLSRSRIPRVSPEGWGGNAGAALPAVFSQRDQKELTVTSSFFWSATVAPLS